MVEPASTTLPLGSKAPDFCLVDTNGREVSLGDFPEAQAYLVIFMCNHSPFVRHIREQLAKLASEYQDEGVAIVGINSSDVAQFPEDSPERMAAEVSEVGYTFPYLFDETREVAKRYHNAGTPGFFLFDAKRRLVYRGQFDDSRPDNDIPVTGADLRAAMDGVLPGRGVPSEQEPGLGCNIKWRLGNGLDDFM